MPEIYMTLEIEVKINYDVSPAERQTRHYPGSPAQIEVNDIRLAGADRLGIGLMSAIYRPWYKWYPKDFMADEKVRALSPMAELVYLWVNRNKFV
ncbi:unnamed protein product [marine sediment metagenome]|uniref:Uncharacterized protein n=1 Tax=marine sediment metagenome TaxID=412755 RepID=X1BE17_9ZZZZ